MDKKAKYYSIMIVPHDARGRQFSWKIPAGWVYVAGAFLLFSFVLAASSVVYSTFLSRRLVNYADTISKNKEQRVIIRSFSSKTSQVSKAIDELAARDNELRKLLGLKGWQNKIRLNNNAVDFEQLNVRVAERQTSLDELKNWVNLVRSRLAATPSLWPVYGRLSSGFGYRASPWRGFHAGLDIRAPYGSPIRVTAPGIVTYVGWRRGYGKTVEISHGYGAATLYAHNSGYAVVAGQKVRKGQVICYVGTTGWTTGPHVHYEVHRYGRPLNPVAFLNLNILSASRLWR